MLYFSKKFFTLLTLGMMCWMGSAVASVAQDLDTLKQSFAKKADPDKARDFQRGIDELAASGILESAVNVGDKAPNFLLPDMDGTQVSLEELLKKGPVVLVWYRGGWCPYCNLHLKALQKSLPDFKSAGAQLVAISPEQPDKVSITQKKQALGFEVLSDMGNRVAKSYGVVFTLPDYVAERYSTFFDIKDYNGDESQTLPLAAAYVINPEGVITYAFLDADYKRRAEPATLLAEVRKLKV